MLVSHLKYLFHSSTKNCVVEINQKVQNSTASASKVHSSNDPNGLERANSAGGGRESRISIDCFRFVDDHFYLATRSRGSITMRMLMGANGIYADGKAQPMSTNGIRSWIFLFFSPANH